MTQLKIGHELVLSDCEGGYILERVWVGIILNYRLEGSNNFRVALAMTEGKEVGAVLLVGGNEGRIFSCKSAPLEVMLTHQCEQVRELAFERMKCPIRYYWRQIKIELFYLFVYPSPWLIALHSVTIALFVSTFFENNAGVFIGVIIGVALFYILLPLIFAWLKNDEMYASFHDF